MQVNYGLPTFECPVCSNEFSKVFHTSGCTAAGLRAMPDTLRELDEIADELNAWGDSLMMGALDELAMQLRRVRRELAGEAPPLAPPAGQA